MDYVLAYDLGTGGVKASLFNVNAENTAHAFVEYQTYYGSGGYHEQDPDDWWNAIVKATKDLLSKTYMHGADIAAIGVSGHSLGIVPIDREGELLIRRTPIWSDSRAGEQASRFFHGSIEYRQWYETTGNGFPAPLYSLFKIMWCRENQKDIYDNTYLFLGTKDYINFKLTGAAVTDHSYASGSGAYDLKEHKYVDEYIRAAGIDKSKLPDIIQSGRIIGTLQKKTAEELGLTEGTPVVCGGVDNACMSLGSGCFEQGDAYASLGSSAWVTVASDKPILDFEKKPYVFAHCVENMYIPSVGVFSSGSSLKWVKTNLFAELKDCKDPYEVIGSMAMQSVAGAHNLLFCPQLAGGSSADASADMKGAFVGLELGHTKADIARATFEGIAFNLKTAHDVLAERTALAKQLLLSGGGAKSTVSGQLYADILGVDIVKTDVMQDAASLGAAALAAVSVGLFKDYQVIRLAHKNRSIIKPNNDNHNTYQKLYSLYLKACELQAQFGELIKNGGGL